MDAVALSAATCQPAVVFGCFLAVALDALSGWQLATLMGRMARETIVMHRSHALLLSEVAARAAISGWLRRSGVWFMARNALPMVRTRVHVDMTGTACHWGYARGVKVAAVAARAAVVARIVRAGGQFGRMACATHQGLRRLSKVVRLVACRAGRMCTVGAFVVVRLGVATRAWLCSRWR
jgi:hypothetical protein